VAGETWRSLYQVAKEATYGVPLAATRQLLGTGDLTRTQAAHIVKVNTGTSDNVRGIKNRAVQAGGKFTQPLDADEIIELFLGCVAGGVVPTTALGASTWVFKPSPTIDSQTWEWLDGYNGWQESGVYVDTLKFTWASTADGDAMVEATLFGKDRIQNTITPSLTTRTPIWMEGWETSVYVDPIGGTPGTTQFLTAISGTLTVTRKLGRKYFAANTQAIGAITQGEFDLTGDVLFEANTAYLAEYADWLAATQRLFRFNFGGNGAVIGTSALKRTIQLDIPCGYTAQDLSGSDAGTRVAKATLQYVYSPTLASSFVATVINSRPTAYV